MFDVFLIKKMTNVIFFWRQLNQNQIKTNSAIAGDAMTAQSQRHKDKTVQNSINKKKLKMIHVETEDFENCYNGSTGQWRTLFGQKYWDDHYTNKDFNDIAFQYINFNLKLPLHLHAATTAHRALCLGHCPGEKTCRGWFCAIMVLASMLYMDINTIEK